MCTFVTVYQMCSEKQRQRQNVKQCDHSVVYNTAKYEIDVSGNGGGGDGNG